MPTMQFLIHILCAFFIAFSLLKLLEIYIMKNAGKYSVPWYMTVICIAVIVLKSI